MNIATLHVHETIIQKEKVKKVREGTDGHWAEISSSSQYCR
jgi:hypothetical protein